MDAKVAVSPNALAEADEPLLRRMIARLEQSPVPFELSLPNGERSHFGRGTARFHIAIGSDEGVRAFSSLDLGRIAEAYMAGAFDVSGDLVGVFELRTLFSDRHPFRNLWRFLQPLLFGQVRTNAAAIRSHYDLGASFYLAFLGGLRCYTQGIYADPTEPLEVSQLRKLDFCLDACGLRPGSHVLEVGPGWGAFSEHAAARGVKITGVTNSSHSVAYMRELGQRLGVDWTIVERDILEYESREQYDAIVLMGIMEHLPDYRRVLACFERLLKPGGRVYLDASATREKYAASSFIYRYIYPGNHSFFILHNFMKAVAGTGFRVRGIFDDRESYYRTFVQWARNFEANRSAVVRDFGEWNYRRFHLYLWGSAHSFLTDTLQCYRMVLEKPLDTHAEVGAT